MRVSHSQIASYATCPEQYRLERVLKVPSRPGWALVGGSALHAMTEDHDRAALGLPREMLGSFDEYFDREIADRLERDDSFAPSDWRPSGRSSAAWPNKEDERWWRHHGPIFFDRWVRWVQSVPWDIVVRDDGETGIEVEVDLPLGEVGGDEIVLKGYIDRVLRNPATGEYMVLDIKTGASKQPTPRQLGTYRLALEDKWGEPVSVGTFWDARSGGTGELYNLRPYSIDRLEYQAQALAFARQNGIYIPAPSTMCAACSVSDYCFEYKRESAIEVPQPYDTPESV